MKIATFAPAAIALAASLPAQSYRDFELVRNRPRPYSSVLELELGASGSFTTDSEDEAIGLEDEFALDGHVYYHNARFSAREAILDAYAGRDGAYVSLKENKPGGAANRLELSSRFVPFYRDGFYRDGEFIPTGRFEGDDYTIYIGFGANAAQGMTVEVGPFVRKLNFDRNDTTDAGYVLPDDYVAYGVRSTFEHNTLQLDRQSGRPSDGYILTLRVEYERNDSSGRFGTPTFMSSLPDNFWRGIAHLEWYLPQPGLGTWTIDIDGQWSDERDRVSNIDAQKPIGFRWVDGDVGVRMDFGSLAIEPFGTVQWLEAETEDGLSSTDDLFFGGGLRTSWILGDPLELFAEDLFLENRSRVPVSAADDVLGEHQFWAGVTVRIGAQRL